MSKLGGKKNTLYHFIGELIQEGKYAWFVNGEGRFRIKWDNAVERYIEYRAKKNPTKDSNIDRKTASNSLREGLLRRYDDADGAKEYGDCHKVGEKNKIVEREFQMPSKVFHSLFGTSEELPGDQVDEKPQVCPDSGISDASDTGFEEAMDVSDATQGNNKREDPVDLTNIATPRQILHISDKDLLDSALEEILTNSDSDVNQPEDILNISPPSGSVEGGIQFLIILEKALLDSDKTGVAYFYEIGEVILKRINSYTFSGLVPAAKEAGSVPITVHTEAGRKLGETFFTYVDVKYEVFKQFIEDPAQLREYANMWSQAHGVFGINSNVAQILGLFGLSDQVSIDEQESSRMQPKDDDNQSDYFADAETSSCGSLDLVGDWSDLEEENGACTEDEDCENATIETGIDNCASMPHYHQEEHLRNSVEFTMENAATKESFEDETQLGNGQDNFKRLGRLICRDTSRLKDMLKSFSFKKEPLRSCVMDLPTSYLIRSLAKKVATLESLQDETQLVNGEDNFERCSICRESSLLKGMRRKLCSLRAEEKGSESLKKGTERRDDSGSKRKYATESLDQEKTTRLHFENETICEKYFVVNHIADRNLFSSFPNRFFQERDTSSRLLRLSSLLEIQSERTERRDDSGSRQKYTTKSLYQEKMTELHYLQREPLRIYFVSSEKNAATLESFEDETQLGNGQDNFERCSICRESSPLRRMLRKLCSLRAEKEGSESLKKGTERRDDSGSRRKYATESLDQEKTTTAKRSVSKAKEETSRQCKNHLTKGKQET